MGVFIDATLAIMMMLLYGFVTLGFTYVFIRLLTWIITDWFHDHFKIVNGRIKKRKVRYWQFGE